MEVTLGVNQGSVGRFVLLSLVDNADDLLRIVVGLKVNVDQRNENALVCRELLKALCKNFLALCSIAYHLVAVCQLGKDVTVCNTRNLTALLK